MANDAALFQQTHFAKDVADVDALNAEFYHRYQYPWPPSFWERLSDGDLTRRMICQELGDWNGSILPASGPLRIWVAGCGTNQAVITAVQFPHADVLGTDLATKSLQTASDNARALGIHNAKFVRTSINESEFNSAFDYIICTGVIHHNADPLLTLRRIRQALKPDGILELMVYNQYHSVFVTGFQKAFQALRATGAMADTDEIALAQALLQELRVSRIPAGPMSAHVTTASDSQLADLLLQPVWHSYDLATFADLCRDAGLELLAPCCNQFDQAARAQSWDWSPQSEPLKRILSGMPEDKVWELVNDLFQQDSPMIWFYTGRSDCCRTRKTQAKIVEEFLRMKGRRVQCRKELWRPGKDGRIECRQAVDFPPPPIDPHVRKFLEALEPGKPIEAAVERAGIPRDWRVVNRLRLSTTSRHHPHLDLF